MSHIDSATRDRTRELNDAFPNTNKSHETNIALPQPAGGRAARRLPERRAASITQSRHLDHCRARTALELDALFSTC